MNNEMVLEGLHAKYKRVSSKSVQVTALELMESGWKGPLPTVMFTKFETYWVRFERQYTKYKIVKVEPWMLQTKSEKPVDLNAPLPVTGQPKFNLKQMYKDKIVEDSKPKSKK
jgi:hypothetical protein